MQEGAGRDMWCMYEASIIEKREEISELMRRRNEALNSLQKKCVEEHGSHLDISEFYHGFCVRCLAYFG